MTSLDRDEIEIFTSDDLLSSWLAGYQTGLAHGRSDRIRDLRALFCRTAEVVVPIARAAVDDTSRSERALELPPPATLWTRRTSGAAEVPPTPEGFRRWTPPP
jgi:hypothetical protein